MVRYSGHGLNSKLLVQYSGHCLNNELFPGIWIANKWKFVIQMFLLFRCLLFRFPLYSGDPNTRDRRLPEKFDTRTGYWKHFIVRLFNVQHSIGPTCHVTNHSERLFLWILISCLILKNFKCPYLHWMVIKELLDDCLTIILARTKYTSPAVWTNIVLVGKSIDVHSSVFKDTKLAKKFADRSLHICLFIILPKFALLD